MIQRLFLFFLVFCLSQWPCPSCAASVKYDLAFRHWGQVYFPWDDWKHWKAQGLAESRLDMSARSSCGATGIMQLMPTTAKELGVNPFDAESNIRGGIKYDSQLYKGWAKIASPGDRRDFTYASYNAGAGWIRKAFGMANSPRWVDVADKLPAVTGKNAKQTQDYVKHIAQFYAQIRNN